MLRTTGTVLFGMIVVGAFASLMHSWRRWRREAAEQKPFSWRRLVARCGLFLATIQGGFLAAFWVYNVHIGGWSNDFPLLRRWARVEFALFVFAVPCLIVGEARYKWWICCALFSSL